MGIDIKEGAIGGFNWSLQYQLHPYASYLLRFKRFIPFAVPTVMLIL